MTTYKVASIFRDKAGKELRRSTTFHDEAPDAREALRCAHITMTPLVAADPRTDSVASSITGGGEEMSTTDYADEIGCGISSHGLMEEIGPDMLDEHRDIVADALGAVLTDEQKEALADAGKTKEVAAQGGGSSFPGTTTASQRAGSAESAGHADAGGSQAGAGCDGADGGASVGAGTFPSGTGAGASGTSSPADASGRGVVSGGSSAGGVVAGSGLDANASQPVAHTPAHHSGAAPAGPDQSGHVGNRPAQTGGFAPRQGKTYGGSDIIKHIHDAQRDFQQTGKVPEAVRLSPEAWEQLKQRMVADGHLQPSGTLDGGFLLGMPIYKNLDPGAPPIQIQVGKKERKIAPFVKHKGRTRAPFATGGLVSGKTDTRKRDELRRLWCDGKEIDLGPGEVFFDGISKGRVEEFKLRVDPMTDEVEPDPRSYGVPSWLTPGEWTFPEATEEEKASRRKLEKMMRLGYPAALV